MRTPATPGAGGYDSATQGIKQNHHLEAHVAEEAERARAETADRAGGELQHDGSCLSRPPVDAELGVDRAMKQPESPGGAFRKVDRRGKRRLGQSTRCHEQRLFERRAFRCIGLVENRGDRQGAVGEETIDAHFPPGHVFLEQDRLLIAAAGLGKDGADLPHRGQQAGVIVDAQTTGWR